MSLTLTYKGVDLEVDGAYQPAEPATPDCAGSRDDFELESVLVGGQDIYDLLASEHQYEIERLALKKIREEQSAISDEAACEVRYAA